MIEPGNNDKLVRQLEADAEVTRAAYEYPPCDGIYECVGGKWITVRTTGGFRTITTRIEVPFWKRKSAVDALASVADAGRTSS